MIRTSIVGATGYTGEELLRILLAHGQVDIRHVTSESSAGKRVSDVLPAFRGRIDLVLEKPDVRRLAADSDVAFFALPHGVGSQVIAEFLKHGKKVVDLSADFRLRSRATYEAWYGVKHASPAWLAKAVYGLPEFNREKIAGAQLVANPGCYATTAILSLAPLLKHKLIDPASIIVDAKSGVTGAGKKVAAMYHYPEVSENFQPYAVSHHRHMPEIEQALFDVSKQKAPLTFVPHLLPMNRGILAASYAQIKKGVTAARIKQAFEDTYANERFVRLLPEGVWPQTRHVAYTNFCDINFKLDSRAGRVIVMAALDNLVKGAAGQAVQNMNLLFGLDEAEGLLA